MKSNTVKHVLSGRSKIDKTKILMTNGSLMKVENIAKCAFCNTHNLHYAIIGNENQFLVFFFSGRLRQVLLFDNAMLKKSVILFVGLMRTHLL